MMSLEFSDPQSYYHASAEALPRPALDHDRQTQVCIIGGGMTGVSAALHLAENDVSVTLIEAHDLGWGASGRSGGQAIIGQHKSYGWLKQHLGQDTAQAMFDASVQGVHTIKSIIGKHNIDCDFRHGHYHVGIKPRHTLELQSMLADYQAAGYAQAKLFVDDVARDKVISPRVSSALYDPLSGHLHPLKYTIGLHRAAIAAGCHTYAHTTATHISETNDGYRIATQNGHIITAEQVLLATNAYIGGLCPKISSFVMPVGTYMIATEPLADQWKTLVPDQAAVADIHFVLNYFRPSADGRMLFGGGASYNAQTPTRIATQLKKEMCRYFPTLGEARIDYLWGGCVGITLNRLPHCGQLGKHKRLFYAQGFSGHGVILTTVYGRLCAAAMMQQPEARLAWDQFSRITHTTFLGGRLLRTPLLMLAMLYARCRDWL